MTDYLHPHAFFERLRNYLVSGNSALSGTSRKIDTTSMTEMVDYFDATATNPGFVELATVAEAQAGTDTTRAVTAQGARAMVGAVKVLTFTGMDGDPGPAGACTATGLAVNDVVLGVVGLSTMGNMASKFESTITVVNQIQQTALEDLSAANFLVLVYRPA